MPERSNGTVSKTVVWATVPRVRIPLSPLSASAASDFAKASSDKSAKEAFFTLKPNLCFTFISSDAATVCTIPDARKIWTSGLKDIKKGMSLQLARRLRVIFYCAFENKHQAFEFERYLKSGSGIAFRNKHFV